MEGNKLAELETSLYKLTEKHRKISKELEDTVNNRNLARIKEEKAHIQTAAKRRKSVIFGLFIVSAIAAYFFYKAVFGMF
ncbi:MAG: hypothetical protein Q4D81_08485 [Eubacteriales bacterium]|nr:hypothetical protein [Eubacteriales bacterium]